MFVLFVVNLFHSSPRTASFGSFRQIRIFFFGSQHVAYYNTDTNNHKYETDKQPVSITEREHKISCFDYHLLLSPIYPAKKWRRITRDKLKLTKTSVDRLAFAAKGMQVDYYDLHAGKIRSSNSFTGEFAEEKRTFSNKSDFTFQV